MSAPESRANAIFVSDHQRQRVLSYLRREPRLNLLLLEILEGRGDGSSSGSEIQPEVLAAWVGEEIVGVSSLRPSVVIDAHMSSEGMAACLPILAKLESGLIKTGIANVSPLWESLRAQGRKPLLDRLESSYVLTSRDDLLGRAADLPPGMVLRCAEESDLDTLAEAARSSLREEGRPDPLDRDPEGFRRWVQGRVARARLLECDGRPVFVGYADVRRSEGWLIQGVYTWPDARRRGYARIGMVALAREARNAGAEHVQLAVVEGNRAAVGLYEGLGFRNLAQLRTILFA